MSRQRFDSINFKPETLAVIGTVNAVIADYARQGYRLTLRQLYYQLIQADSLPASWADPRTGIKNNVKNYKRLGNMVTDGRNAGLIDWDAIEDRGRHYAGPWGFDNPADAIDNTALGYRLDLRSTQPYHIEVMVEKDAVSNILGPASRQLGIGFTANKGYSSASAMYEAGQRIYRAHDDEGKRILVLYFGDHDPSGQDMTRDVTERLVKYSQLYEDEIEVVRLALNMDQVHRYNPPENPAKSRDPRYRKYADEHGESSWELDALAPRVLVDLLEQEVAQYTDDDLLQERQQEQEAGRAELQEVAINYAKVKKHLKLA